MSFKLTSKFSPTGDQPNAIKQLVDGVEKNEEFQVLLGVTGSGKTFTMANVIEKVQRPTLILTHNKTLTAQLYAEFMEFLIRIKKNQVITRNAFLYQLVDSLYSRTETDFKRATFRVKGDTVDINLPYVDYGYRVIFFGDEIEKIEKLEIESGKRIHELDHAAIFPANLYVAPKDRLKFIIKDIEDELYDHEKFFEAEGRYIEAKRVRERVTFDLEMMRELGYCNGIENYSRFFDGRKPGTRPFCLLDYFPDDYLLIVDESHVTLPQVRGMWGGDRARKLKADRGSSSRANSKANWSIRSSNRGKTKYQSNR